MKSSGKKMSVPTNQFHGSKSADAVARKTHVLSMPGPVTPQTGNTGGGKKK